MIEDDLEPEEINEVNALSPILLNVRRPPHAM
jgi:hypothetical protein